MKTRLTLALLISFALALTATTASATAVVSNVEFGSVSPYVVTVNLSKSVEANYAGTTGNYTMATFHTAGAIIYGTSSTQGGLFEHNCNAYGDTTACGTGHTTYNVGVVATEDTAAGKSVV